MKWKNFSQFFFVLFFYIVYLLLIHNFPQKKNPSFYDFCSNSDVTCQSLLINEALHQLLQKLKESLCCSHLWEISKVLHNAGTFLVENSDSQKGHAGTQVLESQMEPSSFGQRAKTPYFCVHLHQSPSKVNLWEALICCYSVHLTKKGKKINQKEIK